MDQKAKAKSTPETKTASRLELRDSIPTVFADGLWGGSVTSGVVRMDVFAENFAAGAPSPQPMVVGRLVMPVSRLESFVRGLRELADRLQQGKAAEAAGPQT